MICLSKLSETEETILLGLFAMSKHCDEVAPFHANCPSRTKPIKGSVVRHSKVAPPMTLLGHS
jgi:hypothetical protein